MVQDREHLKRKAKLLRESGLSYRECGRVLGVSRETARLLMNPEHRERKRVREREKYQKDAAYGERRRAMAREKYANNPEYREKKREREQNRYWEFDLESRCRQALRDSHHAANRHGHVPCNATVEQLAESFTGLCNCCGRSESELTRRLALDHCHTSGDFRGWLCNSCNRGAGLFGDTPEQVYAMFAYLSPIDSELFLQAKMVHPKRIGEPPNQKEQQQ